MGFKLAWVDPNTNEDGFHIYRATAPMDVNNLPTPIDTIGPGSTTYEDGGVVDGNTYYYRVGVFQGSTELISSELKAVAIESHTYALDFTNTSYVDFGSVLNNLFGGAGNKFTVQFTYKPNGTTNKDVFLAIYGYSGENERQFWLSRAGSGVLELTVYFALDGSSYRIILGTTALTDTTHTYEINIEYDGSITTNNGLDRFVVTIDGVSETLSMYNSTGTLGDIPVGTARLSFGTFVGTSGGNAISSGWTNDSQLSKLRIWNILTNRALTDILTGAETGLVACYDINEGSGSIIHDKTANGYDGNLLQSPTWVTLT